MARTSFRFEPNPDMYREFARSDGVRDSLRSVAVRGVNVARGIAPTYSGPTWDPTVRRAGEYKDSLYSDAHLNPSGWRAEFGATAQWWAQVEYGSGRPATSRERPQYGHSPKVRVLGRALDSLRI